MGHLDGDRIFGTFEPAALVGGQGEVLGEVTSTMDVARRRLQEGVPDGYVVLAEYQTAGRGRTGPWRCPAGLGLLMSVVLRIGLSAADQKVLVLMGSVAATQAMRRFGVAAQIKWPNDVVVVEERGEGPSVRKLGGVLVEGIRPAGASTSFLLGVGLNVNQCREHLPEDAPIRPTSMLLEKGEGLDRVGVCRAVLQELNEWYRRVRMGQLERVLARWRRLSCLLDRRIRARVDGRPVGGTVVGIRSTGELILETDPGSTMLLSEEKTELLPW